MAWTLQKYHSELKTELAGDIAKLLAEELGPPLTRSMLTLYHESGHAVVRWICLNETSYTVYFRGVGGINGSADPRGPGGGEMPTESSAVYDGPSDETAVDVILKWAKDDGYSIDLEEMKAHTRDLLIKHWEAVKDYAWHLVLNNGRIHPQFTSRILEKHLGPCKPQEASDEHTAMR